MDTKTEIRDFLESREITCPESTLATYRQCLEAFGSWLEEKPVNAATIGEYLRTLVARKFADDSQRNVYRMLKTFCRWLAEHEHLDRDPFIGRGRVVPRPLHAFRHYAARQWLKAGLEDLTIRQLMRHAQLSTTQIYTQLDEEELAKLHEQASPAARLLAEAGLLAA